MTSALSDEIRAEGRKLLLRAGYYGAGFFTLCLALWLLGLWPVPGMTSGPNDLAAPGRDSTLLFLPVTFLIGAMACLGWDTFWPLLKEASAPPRQH